MVVPEAIKVLRLKSDHTFTLLGTLSKEVGWGYTELVNRLETQRKIKEQAYYAEKKAANILRSKAIAAADLSPVADVLASYGH